MHSVVAVVLFLVAYVYMRHLTVDVSTDAYLLIACKTLFSLGVVLSLWGAVRWVLLLAQPPTQLRKHGHGRKRVVSPFQDSSIPGEVGVGVGVPATVVPCHDAPPQQ
jgi:hypothetical protein